MRRLRRELIAAAAAHGITQLRVFGSVARGEDRPGSDVDLLADILPTLGLLGIGRATEDLERILNATVDLVPVDGLKPDVAARIRRDLVQL